MGDLRSSLLREPRALAFGTSGRRGAVVDLTQLEIYINVSGELTWLLSLPRAQGGVERGDRFYFASDLRPSSPGLAEAVVEAVRDAGLAPVNLGQIPTPALACYALAHNAASIMVTGSHIPFELNGYKLNTSRGELLKTQEAPIGEAVERVRERLYRQDAAASKFGPDARLRSRADVPAADNSARSAYLRRYTDLFAAGLLSGKRILVYQHSAVGRDLLAELMTALGAEVTVAGRSDRFVAIDTEAIDAAQLQAVQDLVDASAANFDAVVSTDGDSDRPLILDVIGGRVRFFGGDLVGMVVAEWLGADAVVVPISCNDAIDRGPLREKLEAKTRIGSPFVVEGMEAALRKGRRRVCGWEANGGFLLGSDLEHDGRRITALATRDAFLPVCAVLAAAAEKNTRLSALFDSLPPRFSRAALLRNFPRSTGRAIVQTLTTMGETAARKLLGPVTGKSIARIDYTDGVRLIFADGEVMHFRPSGNADEFRVYAVADSQARADELTAAGIAEPDGVVRSIERALA
jgi:phosphomannomutase